VFTWRPTFAQVGTARFLVHATNTQSPGNRVPRALVVEVHEPPLTAIVGTRLLRRGQAVTSVQIVLRDGWIANGSLSGSVSITGLARRD
jgi:hypothetical protein